MPGYSRAYRLGSSSCCGPSKDTTCLSDHCLPRTFETMELLHYDRLSVNARCRRTSSECPHVDEDSSSFVRLKWSWRGQGHGLRRRSALPQEMARQDRAATRATPVMWVVVYGIQRTGAA
ncbi:hypothetical protein B0T13DRAFT_302381 [Neurospora crassa]|nr:hypothetical protein B0T13DRAFT_302381 [Neurospora crassa]